MRLRQLFVFILAALFGVAVLAASERSGVAADTAGADLALRKPAIYILAQGDKDLYTLVTLGVADEFNKHFSGSFGTDGSEAAINPLSPPSGDVWAIPEPDWDAKELAAHCAEPNALGGIIVSTYSGYATHFWLLWQTETTTFNVFAQIVSCRRGFDSERHLLSDTNGRPELVSIIAHTPGAGNSSWTVRRTQMSVPLLTLAAVGAGLSNRGSGSNSKTSNLTLTAIAGALFSSAGSKDIPGYSDPVRLRSASRHIGVDIVSSLTWLCTHPDAEGGIRDANPGREMCTALRF